MVREGARRTEGRRGTGKAEERIIGSARLRRREGSRKEGGGQPADSGKFVSDRNRSQGAEEAVAHVRCSLPPSGDQLTGLLGRFRSSIRRSSDLCPTLYTRVPARRRGGEAAKRRGGEPRDPRSVSCRPDIAGRRCARARLLPPKAQSFPFPSFRLRSPVWTSPRPAATRRVPPEQRLAIRRTILAGPHPSLPDRSSSSSPANTRLRCIFD